MADTKRIATRDSYGRALVELGRERPVWSGVTTFGRAMCPTG